MPYLPLALDSLREQSYKNYEVIVQDCLSDDNTLSVLEASNDLPLNIISEADGGIGDGYNRAVQRCHGDIIGSIDTDNLLAKDTLSNVVNIFLEEDEDLAVIYSDVQMIDEAGNFENIFQPGPFSLEKLLNLTLVPPYSTSFFSREVCADQLYYDTDMKTCADFDLWLRLSSQKIKYISQIFGLTRNSRASMSCNSEVYEQFCNDKIFALNKFLAGTSSHAIREKVPEYLAGIYMWAAEMTFHIDGPSEISKNLYRLAKEQNVTDQTRILAYEKDMLDS